MGESWGDLVAGEYQFEPRLRQRRQHLGRRRLRHRQPRDRDPRLRHRQEPAATTPTTASTSPDPRSTPTARSGTARCGRCARPLVEKYDAQFPYDRQGAAARSAPRPRRREPRGRPSTCPGNRRWVQLMFDSFLLQQGATSMLDARDAMLAADQMRFGGANQRRDVGRLRPSRHGRRRLARSTPTTTSRRPSFATPTGARTRRSPSPRPASPQDLRRRLRGAGDPDRRHRPGDAAGRHAPTFTPGHLPDASPSLPTAGSRRSTLTVLADGSRAHRRPVGDDVNLASAAAGATVIGATDGLAQPRGPDRRHRGHQLGRRHRRAQVDESRPSVAVDLAGDVSTVTRVQVSAFLTPGSRE